MEKDNLKLIWKMGVNEDINLYSDQELNNMIIKCARKSMRKIHPRWILRTIVILVVALLLWQISTADGNIRITILRLIILFILTGSMGAMEWSARKMNEYHFNMAVKEWLKSRIDKLEQSIQLQRKYDIAIYIGSFLLGFGTYFMYNYLMNVSFSLLTYIAVFFGFILYLLGCRMMVRKHHKKVLRHLQELYSKLKE